MIKLYGTWLSIIAARTEPGAKREHVLRYSIVYKARKYVKLRSHWSELRIKKEYIYPGQRTIWLQHEDYFRPTQRSIAVIRKHNKLENTFQIIRRLR